MTYIHLQEKKIIMKIVIFGATGRIGSNLLRSALDKGHEVLAIARHPENIKVKHDNLQVRMTLSLISKSIYLSCLSIYIILLSTPGVNPETRIKLLFHL